MQRHTTIRIALGAMMCALPSIALAQTRTANCEYFNAADDKLISGPCLITEIPSPKDDVYTIKATLPSLEVEVRHLKHQGEYHRWTMNGASAAAYEIDRDHICGFTDDLNMSLCIQNGAPAKNSASSPSNARSPKKSRWCRRFCQPA